MCTPSNYSVTRILSPTSLGDEPTQENDDSSIENIRCGSFCSSTRFNLSKHFQEGGKKRGVKYWIYGGKKQEIASYQISSDRGGFFLLNETKCGSVTVI